MKKTSSGLELIPLVHELDLPKPLKRFNIDIPYVNMAIISKKESGKSTLVYNLLKEIVVNTPSRLRKYLKIMIVAPTVEIDISFESIIRALAKLGAQTETFTDLEGIIEGIIQLTLEEEEEEKGIDKGEEFEGVNTKTGKKNGTSGIYFPKKGNTLCIGDEIPSRKKRIVKKKKPKSQIVLVLDDMGDDIKRSDALKALMRKNRHHRCTIILSTQYIHNISRDQLKQVGVFIAFKSFDTEKLERMRKELDLGIEEKPFWDLYQKATYCKDEKEKNFLMCIKNKCFRNFNERIY